MARADHLRASRPQGHHHDGIDLGDGRVIHFAAGPGETKATARVRIDSFETFANGGVVTVRHYSGTRDPEAVVARAMSRLGSGGDYDVVFNNCEHFARWCVTEVHLSEQVVAVTSTGGVVGATAAAAAVGIDVVASAGAVAGLSGSGIMSGLASTGALVGGGAVAGIVTIGALPATASVILVNRALKDDEDLPDEERDAQQEPCRLAVRATTQRLGRFSEDSFGDKRQRQEGNLTGRAVANTGQLKERRDLSEARRSRPMFEHSSYRSSDLVEQVVGQPVLGCRHRFAAVVPMTATAKPFTSYF